MRFYKDIDRMADVFILEDGSRLALDWGYLSEFAKRYGRHFLGANFRKFVKQYGYRL